MSAIRIEVLALSCAIASVCPGPLASGAPAAAGDPAHIVIVGNDYAFIGTPESLAAGPTAFAFENRGLVRHEMSVVRLRPGVAASDVVARGPGAASSKALTDQLVGILVARPGERSGGELLVDLVAGHRYLVVCTLRDTPDAAPHIQLGMIASFDVR